MKNAMKRSVLALGALALLGAGSMAKADTIDASIDSWSFGFTSNNGVHICFTPNSLDTNVAIDPLSATPMAFGTFSVTGLTSAHAGDFDGDTFTMHIAQTSPSADGGSISGDLSGKIRSTAGLLTLVFSDPSGPLPSNESIFYDGDGNAAGLSLTLTGGTEGSNHISPVTYTVLDSSLTIGTSGSSSFTSVLNGGIEFVSREGGPTVPLPSSLFSGTALLGAVLVGQVRRKRNMV